MIVAEDNLEAIAIIQIRNGENLMEGSNEDEEMLMGSRNKGVQLIKFGA